MKALDGLKVLVVEDVAIIALDVAEMLERQGASVEVAMNVKQGMRVAREDFDVALLDGKLFKESSLPIASVLRSRNVPVIFHAGHVNQADAHRVDPNSIFLTKPATDRQIIGALSSAVRRLNVVNAAQKGAADTVSATL